MARQRSSQPYPTSSVYPTSPTASRGTRASSIFPYSTARPPTNYSQQSFLQHSQDRPPVPRHPANEAFDGLAEGDDMDEGETPLYARSDWDASDRSPRTGGSTAWSRSSFAGMTTAPIVTGRANTLGDIVEEGEEGEEDEEDDTPRPRSEYQSPILTGGYAQGMTMSPGMMTATLRTPGTPYTATSATALRHDQPTSGHSKSASWGARRYESARRSTLPSILDLEHLTNPSGGKSRAQGGRLADPFSDHLAALGNGQGGRRNDLKPNALAISSSPHQISPDRDQDLDLDLLTPTAHNRLGRMSVAPARYTPNRSSSHMHTSPHARFASPASVPRTNGPVGSVPRSGVVRAYLTWRPFVLAGLSLAGALLMTISLQNYPGPVSWYVELDKGVFGVPNSEAVGLGVGGWCLLNGDTCVGYEDGDFATADGSYMASSDPLLTSLGDLLTALTALSWLHALYLITTAFLHFYLFFALSIPFDHLHAQEGQSVQHEVDIRVRCERPPFEGYEWAWWAWWGHRQAPIGHIFGFLVAVLAISSFAIAFLFERAVSGAAPNHAGVRIGSGTYIPLVILVFALDPLIGALKYFLTFSSSWSTFLHPPAPSPAAVLLPPTHKPMKHVRNRSGESFFATRKTLATAFERPLTQPPLPGQQPPSPATLEIDDETRRWLGAYPKDAELVPLIASLRGGAINDDFLLSDVGLLYLRPENDEQALLVPPRAVRRELIEDAHHEGGAHVGAEEVLGVLNETFWWNGMEGDVRAYVEGCAGCKHYRGEMKAGMTPVPFTGVTGVTGWTQTAARTDGGESVMAAEMAFAMQKADEETERDRLG